MSTTEIRSEKIQTEKWQQVAFNTKNGQYRETIVWQKTISDACNVFNAEYWQILFCLRKMNVSLSGFSPRALQYKYNTRPQALQHNTLPKPMY